MISLINGIWEMYENLWTLRCNNLHDDTDLESLYVEALDNKIEFYYKNRTSLFESGDYDRFQLGANHTLTRNIKQKRAWLDTLTQRRIATERSRVRFQKTVRPITTYFKPIATEDDG